MSSLWRRVIPASESIPPFSVFTKAIEKPLQDDREYRIIRLDNGLEATLVSDLKTDKAAASLDVAVGHLSDPDDMPGLAHFCEHLLFMGTETFPKENEYKEYLAKNNGRSNAYTSVSNTNYYFDVGAPHLSGALARFSGFFHCPLFNPSSTTRELNAVDSEYKKKHQLDSRRYFQLEKHLSKAGHPYRKFGTGNWDALRKAAKQLKEEGKLPEEEGDSDDSPDGGPVGREVRRRLVEWWKTEYCAGRMHLCVLGRESLDELSEIVSTLFSPVENRQADPLPSLSDSTLGPKEKGTIVFMQSVMTVHKLKIAFPLEFQAPYWRHNPARFIAHFIGHEGPGSLFSYLKAKGWVSALSCGSDKLGRGFQQFLISINLTRDGFEHYQEVIEGTFKYLNLLRSQSSFESFHQEEIATLSSTQFRFLQKRNPTNYAQEIAVAMTAPYPRELLLAAQWRTWNWGDAYEYSSSEGGEDKVHEYLRSFTAENARIFLMGKEDELVNLKRFDNDEAIEWSEEPWYDTKYKVERLPKVFIELCPHGTVPDLFLPGENKFIPENLSVDKKDVKEVGFDRAEFFYMPLTSMSWQPLKRPRVILDTPLTRLWHKKDDRFWVPYARVTILMKSPFVDQSPRTAVLSSLFTDLIDDSLTELVYDAQLANLSYYCYDTVNGLCVSFSGYNDKLPVLMKQVLERMKDLHVDPERLKVMIERRKKAWENFFLGESYELARFYTSHLLSAESWLKEELLEELKVVIGRVAVTADEVHNHGLAILSQVHMDTMTLGNITREEAISLAKMAEEIVGGPLQDMDPYDLHQYALVLPSSCNFVYSTKVRNPNQVNNAITYYLNVGAVHEAQSSLRVVSALMAQIMSEPAFNTLRTKEQLGYVVFCRGHFLAGDNIYGIRIIVQSERTPEFLEQRIEAFLEYMKGYIEDVSPEVFAEQKAGLAKKWTEEHKNLYEEAPAYWYFIENGSLDFYRHENDAKALADVKKEDVLDCFMRNVHPSSPSRSKISVHMHAADRDDSVPNEHDSTKPTGEATYIEDIQAFRKSLERSQKYPPAVSWDDVPENSCRSPTSSRL
ncbi:metalloprotease [Marasmius crinis-equi]|uniref:Metalloprotease n=1 Tax=Marasmius crinis-equi TaxID=585013 RepID=A0ABR3FCD8_9AGAR